MPFYERTRDVISGPWSVDTIAERQQAGWQMVSIEWRRELPDGESRPEPQADNEIPYGLRLSNDCCRLESDPSEMKALLQMMDLLGQDFSYARIVSDLNERGLRMRDGSPWTRIAIFQMMPRLIELGPRIFAEDEWKSLKKVVTAERRDP